MIPQKKPYVKPEFTIIRPGTPQYAETMVNTQAEDQAHQQCVESQAKQ